MSLLDRDATINNLLDRIDLLAERIDILERAALTEEIVDVNNKGWIGSAWQKDPLRLGYSGDQTENQTDTGDGGNITIDGTAVPSGEIWIVQAIAAKEDTTAPSRIVLIANINSIQVRLKTETSPVASIWVSWSGEIVLSAGDKIQAAFVGTTSSDNLELTYHGVKVDIDQ